MDCSTARLLLSLQRGGELDAGEREALDQHVDSCPTCAGLALNEAELDRAFGQAMRTVPIPPDLYARIIDKLGRQPRPVPWRWLAAAACLVIAVGLGGYMWFKPLPALDVEHFVEHAVGKSREPETVEAWFAGQGLPIVAPRNLNFSYLDSYDTRTVKGRRVPYLLFNVAGNGDQAGAIAHVFVFPSSKFQISDVPPNGFSRSNHSVEVMTGDNCVYVIIYTGSTLVPFLRPGL